MCSRSRTLQIRQLLEFPIEAVDLLVAQSEAQGYRHVARLRDEWLSGHNRFAKSGEGLFAGWDGGALIAIGGINEDPFSGDRAIARLRRLYVDERHRQRGHGRRFVQHLLEHARSRYREVRVGAGSPAAGAFFEALGFHPCTGPKDYTHELRLDR